MQKRIPAPLSAALIAGALFVGNPARAQDAQDYAAALESIEKDLAAELEALAEVRGQIAAERPALAAETEKIAADLRDRRRRSQLAAQERDALVHELGRLDADVRSWRDERNYIDSLLRDFRRGFEAQISVAEADSLRADLLAADATGDAGLEAQLALLDTAVARLGAVTAPRALEGQALDADGVASEGKFVEAGPLSWFASGDGELAGLVVDGLHALPEVMEGKADRDQILALAGGEAASPTFDPSLGTAIALDAASGTILAHIRKGGFWIFPILFLALVAIAVAALKGLQLARIKPLAVDLIRRVLGDVESGDREGALASLDSTPHPAAGVIRTGVEMGDASPDDVEEALYEEYLRAMPPLERGLPLIAIASATAPLLGLLGTVTGMIHTFKLINIFGTGDAKSLSSGISEALVTTEFGLAVAIPALILHALLSRKISGIRNTVEMASLAYVNGLKSQQNTRSDD